MALIKLGLWKVYYSGSDITMFVGSSTVKVYRGKGMEHQLGNIPMDRPQFVETSNKTARYSFILGWLFIILSLSWIYLFFHPSYNDYDDTLRILNFGSYFGLGFVYLIFYISYSKPNLMLYWDRLVIHSFHSKGVILLKDVVKVTTGYRFRYGIPRRNQIPCLNDAFTLKNKILIKLNRPVPFLAGAYPPFRWTKFVDEIIIDVLDSDKFAWNLYMRNPEIVFEHSSPVLKTYESPSPLVEMRARI